MWNKAMSDEETKHFSMAGNNFEKLRYFLRLFLMSSIQV